MNIRLWERRQFLQAAGAIGLAGTVPVVGAAEPPPESRRIRLPRYDVACVSPLWVAEELLRAEGFDAIEYVPLESRDALAAMVAGQIDFDIRAPFSTLLALDEGAPIVALGGIHAGCYELMAARGVKSIRELAGRRVGHSDRGRKAFVSLMLAHVGLDPARDVTLVDVPSHDGARLLQQGAIDAYLGFPPEPQAMRAAGVGTSIVNTTLDRPWSQYFCCQVWGNRDFVSAHPAATKRALRALMKAADICAAEPERIARTLADRGILSDYASSATTLKELPYRRWREYDSADSLRFFALRLHEAGLVRTAPKKLLAQGADWRFIEQIKRELKT